MLQYLAHDEFVIENFEVPVDTLYDLLGAVDDRLFLGKVLHLLDGEGCAVDVTSDVFPAFGVVGFD